MNKTSLLPHDRRRHIGSPAEIERRALMTSLNRAHILQVSALRNLKDNEENQNTAENFHREHFTGNRNFQGTTDAFIAKQESLIRSEKHASMMNESFNDERVLF